MTQEIIAIRFGDKILFGNNALARFKQEHGYTQLISRECFRFMSKLDTGDKWIAFANESPTIFELSDDCSLDVLCPYVNKGVLI